jgi:Transposase DNA-binding
MEAERPSALNSFGGQHFGACVLGDRRLTDRAVYTADRIMQHPGGTLPDKLNDNASLLGMYDLVNNKKVTHGNLMAAHFARTRGKMNEARGTVLVLHDTTEVDFSGLDSVKGRGPIGNGGCQGFLVHNSLAYDYDAAEVIGLANQTLHVRRAVPQTETSKQKREHPRRESRLWKKGWAGMGPAAEGTTRVNVADRGADIFEFIDAVQLAGDHYCIRSKSNRIIKLDDGRGGSVKSRLHDWARRLPTLGIREVQVRSNHMQMARQTGVRVAVARVAVPAPAHARGEHSRQTLTVWVIHVLELKPPRGCPPLEWVLLTNVPTEGLEQAGVRLDWYACRPVIEEYHKAMKTGCGVEEQQFTTLKALQVTVGLLSVVAVQLLSLRDLSRRDDAKTRSASEVIDQSYVDLLCLWRFKKLLPKISVHDFCRALGKLGGHLNRKHDGDAGWLVLWRGWTKLQLLVEGAQAAERRR